MIRSLLCALSVSTLLALPAFAQEEMPQPAPATTPAPAVSDVIPPQAGAPAELEGQLPEATYPLLRLTPDKIEVLKLEQDATNVIVGNPKHLLAVMETPRMVLLIPRAPGASHFQVLDADGQPIMERGVIVASPKQDYIRVRRTCSISKNASGCKEFSVFYCPDMCHQVSTPQEETQSAGIEVPAQTASTPLVPPTLPTSQGAGTTQEGATSGSGSEEGAVSPTMEGPAQ